MNRPVFEKSKSSPLIIVRSKSEPLALPKDTFRSSGFCVNCGKWYGWRVSAIHPHMADTEEEYENKQRALSLWLQYKKKGWCDRCIPQPYRTFITLTAGGAMYA